MSTSANPLPDRLDRFAKPAVVAGVVGCAVWLGMCVLFTGPARAALFQAYLVAYLFWIGIALGSLAIVMLHHLVGGAWGFVIRRPAEAGTWTLILMAVLFLPLVVGLSQLYPWAQLSVVAASPMLQHKAKYLNPSFFLIRTGFYFVIWIGLALVLNRNSRAQDRTEDPAPSLWLQRISGPGLVLYGLTVTFAAIDWVMSLEPEWYSSIYGAMLFTGMALSAFSFMIIVATRLAQQPRGEFADFAAPDKFHDLGNLLLAFVMLWAYMSFSQFLIMWSGNLSEEIPWYLRRSVGGWRWIAIALMLFHFFLPFFVLLFRESKRRSATLWKVAAAILVMHFVDLVWLVVPSSPSHQILALMGLVPAMLFVGGFWMSVFLLRLSTAALLPPHDPLLAEVLHHEGGH